MNLYAPNGKLIVGTLERIYGVAGIIVTGPRNPATGEFQFDYDGETDVDWNSQETELTTCATTETTHRAFVDADGVSWPENQLTLKNE